MNIAIVTAWFEGGAGYVSRAYMDALMQQGHDVKIYVRGGRYYATGDPKWELPNVTWAPRYEPLAKFTRFNRQYINMGHFEQWLQKHNIQIIITNEDHVFDMPGRAQKLGYIVGTYIDYYREDTISEFKKYDFLLCNTKRHHSVFQDMPTAFYIPWGTNIDVFHPQPHKKQTDNDTLVFFHSANFGGRNCRKGTDRLLQAFQQIRGKTKLVIHSQAPLSKFGDEAAEIVKNDDRIEFIHKTVPAPGLYHRGDVFVYPSRLEGIGLCVPEALACGLPVITTDNAPMNEFVRHNENGLLVTVAKTRKREDNYYWPEKIPDIDDLAEKMQIYVDNSDLVALHKKAARKSAEERLDWMKNAAGIGSRLTDLADQLGRTPRRPTPTERLCWGAEAGYVALLTHVHKFAKKLLRRS
ncbi:MAG: glycosyltransferase family 4 protein [Desulfobacterales bacterium]